MRIESVQGGTFDLNLHEGRLFARQLVAFANYESAHKGARITRAQQHRATQGLLHGGAHYGYNSDGTLHPEHAGAVRHIADAFLLGLSPSGIAHELNTDAVRPPRDGAQWNATTVRAILASGRLHRRRNTHHTGPATTAGRWDEIISPDESALIEALLLRPFGPASRSAKSLLGGQATCADCGNVLTVRMSGRPGHRSYLRTYACRSNNDGACGRVSIAADRLDAFLERTTIEILNSPRAHTLSPLRDPQTLREELFEAATKSRALLRAYGSVLINRNQYLLLRAQYDDITRRCATELDTHIRGRVRRTVASTDAEILTSRWAAASISRKRAMLGAVLGGVEVAPASTLGRFETKRIRVILADANIKTAPGHVIS